MKIPQKFFELIFIENVAKDPVQLLAKTWCPYLFWVLEICLTSLKIWQMSRNLQKNTSPHGHLAKFEPQKRHHMGTSQRSSPKQNSTIWAPRKARAPNKTRPYGHLTNLEPSIE